MYITASAALFGFYQDKGLEFSTTLECAEVIGELITFTKNVGFVSVEDFESRTEVELQHHSPWWSKQLISYFVTSSSDPCFHSNSLSKREYGFRFNATKRPPTLQDEISFLVNNSNDIPKRDLQILTEFLINEWSNN